MPIKHIILEGGAYLGISALGVLSKLHENNFYNIDDIETIYGTSIGAFIGGLLCLKMKWSDIIEYVIDRPWHKIIHFSPEMLFNLVSKKGIFDITLFYQTFENLLKSKDLDKNITMKELYDYSNIELHVFSTKLSTFKGEDISYKTHPDMEFIKAIYISSSIPFLFQPMWYKNSYFLDGGLLNNYPIDICIGNGAIKEEIMGIRYDILTSSPKLVESSSFLEFILDLFRKFFSMRREEKNITINNQIIIPCNNTNFTECQHILQDSLLRKKYIVDGEKSAQSFLFYQKKYK